MFLAEIRVRRLSRLSRAAACIQSLFRKYLFKKKIQFQIVAAQCMWRGFRARKTFVAMKQGFSYLQSLFRGHCIRRQSSPDIVLAAKRLASARRRALLEPHTCLGARTYTSLQTLQRSKRLSEIIDAVRTLELSTKVSRECCFAFAKTEAPDILFGLMESCNRSLPHQELLHYTLKVLKNISDHCDILMSVGTANSVDTLLDLLQMFRDKDSIFFLVSLILERIIFFNRDLMVSLGIFFVFYSVIILDVSLFHLS